MKKELAENQAINELAKVAAIARKRLFVTLALSTTACAVLTVFAPIMGQSFYSNVLAIITSGTAFAMSIQVIRRQKLEGLFPRLYASFGIGIALWFIAETVWAYYELVALIEPPVPSIADGLWLAGYVPLFYFLYGILRYFSGSSKSVIVQVVTISSIALGLVANVVFSISQSADFSNREGIVSYVVTAAYPVADMFLIVPAVAAFIQLRDGKLTSAPWMLIIVATIIFIVADIGYAYFIVIGFYDTIWVWNPLYNLGYLAIASSLFWHKQFFTIDEKKVLRKWQEQNR